MRNLSSFGQLNDGQVKRLQEVVISSVDEFLDNNDYWRDETLKLALVNTIKREHGKAKNRLFNFDNK